jgi:ABC-type antimicrobial peptide transport system permease subunit
VLGICATLALRGWIVSRGGDITFFDLSIDAAVLLQTAFIALATGVIAGVGPALYETRRLHANPLRTMASSDKVRQRWRSALVVFEIAVTVALLVVTTAMIDGYQRARTAHFGFPTRPLMSVRVENPKGVDVARVLDAAGELAGVAAAEASTGVPYHRSTTRERVASDPSGSASIVADRSAITPGYFAALGVRIRAGRAFSDLDDAGPGSAIANEALVNQLFEGRDPIGQRIWIRQKSYDIVGVVANYKTNLFVSEPEPQVFFPIGRDNSLTQVNVLVRAAGDPATLVQPVRRAIRQAAPGTDATSAFPIDQILGIMGQEMLIGTAPLFPLVAIGMLLTTAGIYGVLAFSIARRARELAVRVAIGASGWDLVRLVAAHTLRLVVVGCSIGIALTFCAGARRPRRRRRRQRL